MSTAVAIGYDDPSSADGKASLQAALDATAE